MRILRKIRGFTLLDKVKRADIRKHRIAASPTRKIASAPVAYGYLTQMSQERKAKKTVLFKTDWSKAYRGRPRTRWRDYVENLSWSRLGTPPEHLSFVADPLTIHKCRKVN